METQALVMGGATVGVWTANIGLLVRHWRRRLLNDLPEVRRPYVVVVSGGVLLTLYVTFMTALILHQVGVLPPDLAAAALQPKVLWGFLILSLAFGVVSVVLAWHLDFAPRMRHRHGEELRLAAREGELEALNRIEVALNEPLTELLFAVRGAVNDPALPDLQRAKIEGAYQAGRQVVAALDRVAAEIENGTNGA